MHIGLRQWGNSKAIRLPHKLIKTLNLAPNQLLEATVTAGGLLLRPASTSRQQRIQLLHDRMATLSEGSKALLITKMEALSHGGKMKNNPQNVYTLVGQRGVQEGVFCHPRAGGDLSFSSSQT